MKSVIGVDPGLSGAFVVTDGKTFARFWKMPLIIFGKEKSVSYFGVNQLLKCIRGKFGNTIPVFLERAVSFGMGTKAAFNYGRGFEVLTISVENNRLPLTMVEASKWTKEMHEGVSQDLKPKLRSLRAAQRLYPGLLKSIPKSKKGNFHDGGIDALLLAGYGLRRYGVERDFY